MKSQYDYFELREVTEEDDFNWDKIGFFYPIKVRFVNDWKFCFAYDLASTNISIDYFHRLLNLRLKKEIDCINFVVHKTRRSEIDRINFVVPKM